MPTRPGRAGWSFDDDGRAGGARSATSSPAGRATAPDAKPLTTGAAPAWSSSTAARWPPTSQLHGPGLLGTTVLDLSGMVPRDAGRWLLCLDVDGRRGRRPTGASGPRRWAVPTGSAPTQADGLARQLAPYRLSQHADVGRRPPARSMELPDLLGIGDPRAVDPAPDLAPRGRPGAAADPDRRRPRRQRRSSWTSRSPRRSGMGPHGLLVGATGSGKSELLRTSCRRWP